MIFFLFILVMRVYKGLGVFSAFRRQNKVKLTTTVKFSNDLMERRICILVPKVGKVSVIEKTIKVVSTT